MMEVKNVSAILPKSWKKLFNSGVVKTAKMRFCNECSEKKVLIDVIFKITKIKNSKLT